MFGRRGFLKAIFGASVAAVTRPVGAVVEALATRKVANQILSFVTRDQILDAKFFYCPYIPLLVAGAPKEMVYGEGRLP